MLVPIAGGLEDSVTERERIFQIILKRFAKLTGQDLSDRIVFNKSYAAVEFSADYNAFRGNAYGVANTLRQTVFLKPKMKNKKIQIPVYCRSARQASAHKFSPAGTRDGIAI